MFLYFRSVYELSFRGEKREKIREKSEKNEGEGKRKRRKEDEASKECLPLFAPAFSPHFCRFHSI